MLTSYHVSEFGHLNLMFDNHAVCITCGTNIEEILSKVEQATPEDIAKVREVADRIWTADVLNEWKRHSAAQNPFFLSGG